MNTQTTIDLITELGEAIREARREDIRELRANMEFDLNNFVQEMSRELYKTQEDREMALKMIEEGNEDELLKSEYDHLYNMDDAIEAFENSRYDFSEFESHLYYNEGYEKGLRRAFEIVKRIVNK